jgi:hypothetical protein
VIDIPSNRIAESFGEASLRLPLQVRPHFVLVQPISQVVPRPVRHKSDESLYRLHRQIRYFFLEDLAYLSDDVYVPSFLA